MKYHIILYITILVGIKTKSASTDTLLQETFSSFTCSLSDSLSVLHLKVCTFAALAVQHNHLAANTQFQQTISCAQQLESDGYVPLFHGQQSEFGFYQDFTCMLIDALYKNQYIDSNLPENFFFMCNPEHIIVPDYHTSKQLYDKATKLQNILIKQIPNGLIKNSRNYLSANLFLFGNTNAPGACTWHYVINNHSNNPPKLDLNKTIFNPFNLPKLIQKKFHGKVASLKKRYKQLYSHGRLVVIGIPEKIIDTYSYLAQAGRKKATWKGYDGTLITTPTNLINCIQNSPFNLSSHDLDRASEMAMPITQHYLLNPDSNIFFYAFNPPPFCKQLEDELIVDMQYVAQQIAQLTTKYFKNKPLYRFKPQ